MKKWNSFKIFLSLTCFLEMGAAFLPASVWAGVEATASSQELAAAVKLNQAIIRELELRYPRTRAELTSPISWLRGNAESSVASVKILEEGSRAQIRFIVRDENQIAQSEGVVSFAAWMTAPVAVRRIQPNEKLSADLFTPQEVNVAAGMAREYRGLILPLESDFSKLEARQTILEGQYPLSSGVQKLPDLRRGDVVRVQLVSGVLTLSTSGTAQEQGYTNGKVRVTASKNKRELTGILKADGSVEVKL